MILTYHKVLEKFDGENNATSLLSFEKQIKSLKGKTVVSLADYDMHNKNHIVLSFDDGYSSIHSHVAPILNTLGYPFEIFIVKDFFDQGENGNGAFMDREALKMCVNLGGHIQYHTKTHPKLTEIEDREKLEEEIKVPDEIKNIDPKGFEYFAYPFWQYNDRILNIVKKYYKGARSGNGYATNSIYAMDSIRMCDSTKLEF